jgi:pimeloyl-ACP methyl ester carboxylesterase
MKSRFLFLASFCLIAMNALAQTLPRRAYLGIKMENLTNDAKNILGLKQEYGVLISEVLPNSTATEAGFKKGDILLKLGDVGFNNTTEVISYLNTQQTGSMLTYEIFRAGKFIKGKSALKGFPTEAYNDLEVIYTESSSEIGSQRIIITKPIQTIKKKLPVVAFIGGIGCYSLDAPMDTSRSEIQLLNMLSRAGFLCARLEKPGMGDNAKFCKACKEVSFTEETNSYLKSIEELKKREDVDPDQIFIFGHSMGGVFGPLIAQQTSIRGIIGYGTIGSNFIEYLAKTRRTIGDAYGMDPIEKDQLVKDFCECAHYYFVENLTSDAAGLKKSICKEYMTLFDLRSAQYNRELYNFNFPALWKDYSGKALLVWGESDYISSKEDHEIITGTINYYHPGNASFVTIKNADHGMYLANNFQEAVNNKGPYNPAAGLEILHWLQTQI